MNDGMLKVTPITATQPQSSAKFSITATIDGFPIQVEVEGKADSLRAMIDRLKAIGAEPPQLAQAPTSAPIAVAASEKKAAPVCPEHHVAMRPSRKPGRHFCPKQNDDGSYCQHQA